jgi:hypothetical protein
MNYSTLTGSVEDIVEKTFTAAQLVMFVQQAEQKIYNAVQFPDLRKHVTGAFTADNEYLAVPTDFLWTHALSVVNASSQHVFLINKDVNYIREAYPVVATTGLPKHYAYFSEDYFLVGPTPDSAYVAQLDYGYYPESIVTATNTWLGDNFDSALLNGTLVEAIRFMKGEQDMVTLYQSMYLESLTLLRGFADGKLRKDAYRDGQYRFKVG